MTNYIEFFYDDQDRFVARIHKNGKVRTITSEKNLKKLLDICYKNGFNVTGEGYIDSRIFTIAREYEDYINKKKRKLQVFEHVTENMKLKRKNKGKGNRITALILAGSLIAGGFAIGDAINNNSEAVENPDTFYEITIGTDSEDFHSAGEAEQDLVETVQNEINQMIDEQQSFHFNYEDRSSSPNMDNARRYQDIFEKYARIYGVDPNLLMAIAAQESGGDHYNHLDGGPACGIMQIERAVHIGNTITAYNFETGQYDTFKVTEENINDLDTNIRIGAMVLRDCIRNNHHNIFLALQTYNFGYGNMDDVLDAYMEKTGLTRNEVMEDRNNNGWLEYRNVVDKGDPQYLEHVLSYMGTNTITIRDPNNNPLSVTFTNDYLSEKTY